MRVLLWKSFEKTLRSKVGLEDADEEREKSTRWKQGHSDGASEPLKDRRERVVEFSKWCVNWYTRIMLTDPLRR